MLKFKILIFLITSFPFLRMFFVYQYPVRTKLILYRRRRNPELVKKVYDLLHKHNSYFRLLNEQEQKKFISRTLKIEIHKRFVPAEGIEIDFRHRILVSSVITQLTFGFARYYDLPNFHLIQIYPDTFYSGILNAHAKGLTFSSGRILMSWSHFDHGMLHTSDNIHLGLHEFAHAMMLQFDNFRTNIHWKYWDKSATHAIEITKSQEDSFFRRYGTNNKHEFWAVCVETFFESPIEFKTHFPDLYSHTCKILRQDISHRIQQY